MSQMLTSGHRSSSREEFLVTFLSLHHMILSGQLLNSSLLRYPKSTLTNNTLPDDDDGDDNGPPGIRDDMCEGLLTLSFQGAIGAPDEGFPAIACRFPRLNKHRARGPQVRHSSSPLQGADGTRRKATDRDDRFGFSPNGLQTLRRLLLWSLGFLRRRRSKFDILRPLYKTATETHEE